MKKLFILLAVLTVSLSAISQKSKITGVITYFYNEYQGDKPDLGSKVHLIDSLNTQVFNYEQYKNFSRAKMYWNLIDRTADSKAKNDAFIKQYGKKRRHAETVAQLKAFNKKNDEKINKYMNYLVELDADTKEKFKKMDSDNLKMIYSAKGKDNVISRTISGTGEYSIEVNPGTYYLLIISKNRKGQTVSEALGQVYCKKVKLESGDVVDISHNFELY